MTKIAIKQIFVCKRFSQITVMEQNIKAKTLSYYPPINRLHSLNQHLLSSVFNRCNIPNLSTAILSISEKEFEEFIPPFEVLIFL